MPFATQEQRETAVRARAHQIWENEGRPDGRHENHWAVAAQEVDAASHGKAKKAPSIKRSNNGRFAR